LAQEPLSWTLSEIAEIVGGELHGPPDLKIGRPVPAGYDDSNGITFAESAKYLAAVESSSAAAVIVGLNEVDCTKPHIRCRSPREAFGRLLAIAWRELPLEEGIHPAAIVSPNATVERTARIGAYAVVESGAIIGADARVYPFCYVGEQCRLGTGSKLYPNVVLYRDVWIGERSIVHSGAVIGADGFGYFWDGTRHRKVPQVGGVRIGDDCEIGALTAVDRATAGETQIGNGTKIDNLVQIAHNVEIGSDTVVAGQTGISGSSRIGSRVTMGGNVGVSDHVSITDDVVLGARTGVAKDINEPGQYWGSPAQEAKDGIRAALLTSKLPEIVDRIRRLEKEIAELRAKLS
jgi:UDP-3-O-[3-hydroxymyristoyl] glucosamine N-acyltransferase